MSRRALAVLCSLPLAGVAPAAASADVATHPRTWFVQAGAAAGAAGTHAAPLATPAEVERRSRAGDRIVVLPAATALTGGLRLKPGQALIGAGPAVGALARDAPAPRLTNPDRTRLDGDAVRLADGVVVRNLRITATARGGIYGHDVTGVTVSGNDVSDSNRACLDGFLIPPFAVPTTVPGVGIPISDGLQNGWAAIMLDATGGTVRATIDGNDVHDSGCADGIDVRASGTAVARVRIGGNDVRELREGPALESILAIGLQAREHARIVARLDDNRQAGLGNDEDFGAGPGGADSEGIFVNPADAGSIRATITRNRYAHTPGRGGFSANGLEFVSMGDGARGLVDVRDSRFAGPPGDVIEQLALGTNATLRLRLDDVTATGSTGFSGSGFGDTVVIPGNNGDCVIAASGGAGNTVDLRVRSSRLTRCANNGLTLGSAVSNGQGPTRALRLDVSDSVITGNQGANLRIGNVTALGSLDARVERTDLSGARGLASSPADLVVEELSHTDQVAIDLGGGPLGSAGGNCLAGGPLAALVVGYAVDAASAWWGAPGGPAPGRTVVAGGVLRTRPPLAAASAACPAGIG